MGTQENLEQLDFALTQPNTSLRLYNLAKDYHKRTSLMGSAAEFVEIQREIAAAKAGG